MCGAGSGNLAASSTPTAPTTPGGVPRTGIPMGSTEIGNLGVSSAAAVPIITVTTHHQPHRADDPDGARRHAAGREHDSRRRAHRCHHGDTEHRRGAEHGTGPVDRHHDVPLSRNPTRETQP